MSCGSTKNDERSEPRVIRVNRSPNRRTVACRRLVVPGAADRPVLAWSHGRAAIACHGDSPGHQARPAISMPREVPPPARSGSGRPPGCTAHLLGLGLERLQVLNGWVGVCEHAGEGRFHPRVGQVLADPACGVEPGCFHPG